jgi:hypothetical protein
VPVSRPHHRKGHLCRLLHILWYVVLVAFVWVSCMALGCVIGFCLAEKNFKYRHGI